MEISKQLDYEKKGYVHPEYRFSQVLPLSGGQTVTVSTAGGQETQFEIPVRPVNLSRTYLQFQASIAALAANSNMVFGDCIPFFQQVQAYTRSGLYLADLNYANNYTKVVLNAETKLPEFLNNNTQSSANIAAGDPTADPQVIGSGAMFYRNNILVAAGAGVNPPAPRPTMLGVGSNLSYTEPAYLLSTAAVNNICTFNVTIDLGKFKNTIFSLNKDLYFGEIIILRLVWAPGIKVAYRGTQAGGDIDDTPVPLASDVNISQLSLKIAVEKNQGIQNQLLSKISAGGLSILVPYVHSFKTNLGGSTQSVSIRLNRGHGIRLRKVYHSLFNNAETANTAYDHNNLPTAAAANLSRKTASYYTMLNNERLQEFDLVTRRLDDWNILKDSLKGSVIQNHNIYHYNWFHRDVFDGEYSMENDMSNLAAGLDLNTEQKWDIFLQVVNANYNHYTFAVVEKLLTVTPNGITII